MKLRLTKAQMLAQWKMRHHLEPMRADCVSARTQGPALDAYCEAEMRSRYVELLATGAPEYLSPRNVALQCTIKQGKRGAGVIELPEGVVRVIGVRLVGWESDATVVTEAGSLKWRLQMNRFSTGGIVEPVALWNGCRQLEVFSTGFTNALPMIEHLDAVIDEGEDVYAFDERAWELLI